MTLCKNMASLTLRQLLDLIEKEGVDLDQEIRVWVERFNEDGASYLEGRRLVGIRDDPRDRYCCLVAAMYNTEEDGEE